MLAKSLGISQLIYTASVLSVPEPIIQQTQRKLFSFLWKNKKERTKRQEICQPFDKGGGGGGLNFPCFRTAVKVLRLSWIGKLLRPIYTVRFLLAIVACDFFCRMRFSRHGKIVYDFYDIELPVATIVVGF